MTLEEIAWTYAELRMRCAEDRRLGKPNARRIKNRNMLAQVLANAGWLVGHDSVSNEYGDVIVTF